MYDVEIRSFDPVRIALLRHRGPYPEIGPVFERIYAWAGERGHAGPDALGVGLFYDDPQTTPQADLRSAAGVMVEASVAPDASAGVEVLDVEGGEYAVLTHKGPYEKLGEIYPWLFGEWLPKSGRMPDERPSVEIYLNNCAENPPEELLTEIRIPLAPAGS